MLHNHFCIVIGSFTPIHSSIGLFNPHHVWDFFFYSTACLIIGFFNPQHSWDIHPTAYLISGNLLPLHCIPEIFISLHCHYIFWDLHPSAHSLHLWDLYSIAYFGISILLFILRSRLVLSSNPVNLPLEPSE